jgi:hypothetical protein
MVLLKNCCSMFDQFNAVIRVSQSTYQHFQFCWNSWLQSINPSMHTDVDVVCRHQMMELHMRYALVPTNYLLVSLSLSLSPRHTRVLKSKSNTNNSLLVITREATGGLRLKPNTRSKWYATIKQHHSNQYVPSHQNASKPTRTNLRPTLIQSISTRCSSCITTKAVLAAIAHSTTTNRSTTRSINRSITQCLYIRVPINRRWRPSPSRWIAKEFDHHQVIAGKLCNELGCQATLISFDSSNRC